MTEEALIADRLDELRKEMELRFTGEFVDNAVNRLDSASNFLRRIANQPPAQDGLVEALDDATIDEIILNFAGGIVQVPSKHNPRGYVSYYRPRDAMRNALSAIKGDKS